MESFNVFKKNLSLVACFSRIPSVMIAGCFLLLLMASSCGSKGSGKSSFPKDFSRMNDSRKVAYVMKNAAPDSVARFICRAALGEIEGVRIDTLSSATLYAYENYKDDDLQTFAIAYDEFAESLPLDKKMTLRKLAAEEDAMGMGYQLGLEYVNAIRVNHKNAVEVEKEIAALKRVCSRNVEDSSTFTRFMKGFKVALEVDGGNEIPREIYNKYSR